MTDLYTAIFTDKLHAPLTAQEAAALIGPARTDNDALERILLAYGGLLVIAVARHGGTEDARQTALLAAMTAIRNYDPDGRRNLAAAIKYGIADAFEDAAAADRGIAIPRRVYQRYVKVMSLANRDTAVAADLAPSEDLARETFWAVHELVAEHVLDVSRLAGHSGGIEEGTGWVYREPRSLTPEASQYAAEDRLIAELALGSLDAQQRQVVDMAYGFAEVDPIPPAEIASRLGTTTPAVNKTRAAALTTMRASLGVV